MNTPHWFARLSGLSDFETEMILQKKTRIKPKGKEEGGLWVNRKPSGKIKPRTKSQPQGGRPKDDN